MGVIDALAAVAKYIPTVEKPKRLPSLYERLFWTLAALLVYLVMANVPLYGVKIGVGEGISILSIIFAARHGTLMELGIGPIVTAGLIMQVLVGAKLIDLDLTDPDDRIKFTESQKTLAVLFALIQAVAFAFGGYEGVLPPTIAVVVALQLFLGAFIVILLDEMLQKGWGLGSGVSLFILAGVAWVVFWNTFAPVGPDVGLPYFGFVPALIVGLMTGTALQVLTRYPPFPDLLGFLATVITIVLLVYLEGVYVDIPVTSQRFRGIKSKVPLKLLYVENIPVLLVGILAADLIVFSDILRALRNPVTEFLADILAKREVHRGMSELAGGLAYYITPPRGISVALLDPVRLVVSFVVFVALCIVFGFLWVELAGLNPRSQAEQLMEAGLHIPGMRRNIKILERMLAKYIYPLTALSSLIVAIIGYVADIFGVYGTGMGILLAVGIIYQYYMLIAYERALEAYPLLRKIVGE